MEHEEIPSPVLSESELESLFRNLMNIYESEEIEDFDKNLIKHVLDNISLNEEGRIVVPCLWDERVIDSLPSNYWIAHNILLSMRKKYEKDPNKFKQYDDVIQQQLRDGILVESDEIEKLKSRKDVSFIAHNAVFRPTATSTKCRVVLLSNICEKGSGNTLSHNQVSIPGPQLNNKIATTCTLYRFNKFLMIYDLEKAFLQIGLKPEDMNKLHILWFKNIEEKSAPIALKFQRLPFGMRFSPFLLMVSLFYILIVNNLNIPESISNMLFNLCYMDNLAFSSNSSEEMLKAYHLSLNVFSKYSFNLQQFVSNCKDLNDKIESEVELHEHKLFGMRWNNQKDTLSAVQTHLNPEAGTKREMLSTINSNYDVLGIQLPVLNRAKLFMNKLQLNTSLGWDTKLGNDLLKEWRNISAQTNVDIPFSVPRRLENYDADCNLVIYVDASKDFMGCVVFLNTDLDLELKFVLSKNKLLNQNMKNKTIPVLELLAIKFGLKVGLELKQELSNAFIPVKIQKLKIFSDSMISLEWLSSKFHKTSKVEKRGPQVNNPLESIATKCEGQNVDFFHVKGEINPADCTTRTTSKKLLLQSNFHSGPRFSGTIDPYLSVPIQVQSQCSTVEIDKSPLHVKNLKAVFDVNKYSSFRFTVLVYHFVLKFVHKIKLRLKQREVVGFLNYNGTNKYSESVRGVLKASQEEYFPEVFSFFLEKETKDIPIITQLNLFLGDDGLLKVHSKMRRLESLTHKKFPILLHKNSPLTKSLIMDYHRNLLHSGTYRTLSELNKEFYIPAAYSTVKKTIRACLVCRKFNGRPPHFNPNDYRPFRVNPSPFPFRDVAIDHIGPFQVRFSDGQRKAYILIITCLWSRACNLIVSPKLDNEHLLLGLQQQIFEFGVFQNLVSDNGSPIVSSLGQIGEFIKDPIVQNFLTENNIKQLQFQPYPAKASFLGGFVENLVKQVKRMIISSLSKRILDYEHFLTLIKQCRMLINKRPVGCKRILSDQSSEIEFESISPEMLIYGREIPVISVIPQLDSEKGDEYCPTSTRDDLFETFHDLRAVKHDLESRYHAEFVDSLRSLSTNQPGRYKKLKTTDFQVNDLVTIRQDLVKPYNYPLGLISSVERNDLGDVVAVKVRKSNGEIIRRHVSDIILLERSELEPSSDLASPLRTPTSPEVRSRPTAREAARKANERIHNLVSEGQV